MKTIREVLGEGKKGAFYARVSSDKQTIDMQRHHVYGFIKNYEGEIVKEYIDPGESAFKKKITQRPQMMKLIEGVEQGKYDFVIVYADDRLARSELEHMQIRLIMKQTNTDVILTSTSEIYTERDSITQLIRDGATRYEVERISHRTRDAYKQRTADGKRMGGPIPYGYREDEKTKELSIVEDEKDVVLKIYEMYHKGDGFSAIANMLNEQKEQTHCQHWKKEAVKRILTNPFYAGYVTNKRIKHGAGNSVEAFSNWEMERCEEIQPIMSKAEWLTTIRLFEQKRNGEIDPKKLKTEYILRDLIHCKNCDLPLVPKNQETKGKNGKKYGHKKYICPNKSCKMSHIVGELHDSIFNSIVAEIKDKVISKSHAELIVEIEKSVEDQMRNTQKETKRLTKQIKNCLVLVKESEREIDALYNHKKRLSEDNLDIDPLLDVMLDYRIHLLHEIKESEEIIKQKQLEIEHIQEVSFNRKVLQQNVLKELALEFSSLKLDIKRIRHFLVHIVDKITIDKDMNTAYTLKINLGY